MPNGNQWDELSEEARVTVAARARKDVGAIMACLAIAFLAAAIWRWLP
jgi:hypothetical protein